MSRFADRFQQWYSTIRGDIVRFAVEALRFDGVHNPHLSENQQLPLMQCVQDDQFAPLERKKRRIAVKSGRGTGKTTCEVIIAFWRAFLGVDALVVVTAPTMNQLRDVWIAEARRVIQNAHPLIRSMVEITNTKVVIGRRPTWGIWTRSASKPDNMRGYHQQYLTIIVDEASNVNRDILQVAKASVTNEDSLIMMVGNPSQRASAFFDAFHKPSESPLWIKHTWSALDCAHVDREQIRRLEAEYGRQSDEYRVEILGEFPIQDPNCLVSADDLWGCAGVPILDAVSMRGQLQTDKAIGIDLARFGSDESVIYRRSGMAVVESCVLVKTEPLSVIQRAFAMQAQAGWSDQETLYVIDADGMGQGVMGFPRMAGKRLLEFRSNGKSTNPAYANRITEAYFNLAKLAKQRRIHIPNDERLVHQLASRLYGTDLKGKLILEKKDQYVKRTMSHSPDRADALALAFYDQAFMDLKFG